MKPQETFKILGIQRDFDSQGKLGGTEVYCMRYVTVWCHCAILNVFNVRTHKGVLGQSVV